MSIEDKRISAFLEACRKNNIPLSNEKHARVPVRVINSAGEEVIVRRTSRRGKIVVSAEMFPSSNVLVKSPYIVTAKGYGHLGDLKKKVAEHKDMLVETNLDLKIPKRDVNNNSQGVLTESSVKKTKKSK